MLLGLRGDGPEYLVDALLNLVQPRCSVCKKPATRRAKMQVVFDSHYDFCDDHDFGNINKGLSRVTCPYDEHEHAWLLRKCYAYLRTVELKT